ncbi:MAG: ATP-binding protein, partial [Cyanobacteriota bacterium]
MVPVLDVLAEIGVPLVKRFGVGGLVIGFVVFLIFQAQNLESSWHFLCWVRRRCRGMVMVLLARQPRSAIRDTFDQPKLDQIQEEEKVADSTQLPLTPSTPSAVPPRDTPGGEFSTWGAMGPAPGPLSRVNPFGDRGRITDPERFFYREELLERIFEELRKGSSLSLVGEAQIGKSSLLAMVQRKGPEALVQGGTTFLTIDMQGIGNEHEFFDDLCSQLHLGQTLRGRALKHALRERPVVLCLDEMEKMVHPELFTWQLRAELRGLADGPEAPLSLVIASRSPLSALFPDNPRETSP